MSNLPTHRIEAASRLKITGIARSNGLRVTAETLWWFAQFQMLIDGRARADRIPRVMAQMSYRQASALIHAWEIEWWQPTRTETLLEAAQSVIEEVAMILIQGLRYHQMVEEFKAETRA